MAMPERTDKPVGRVITHPLGLVEADIVTKILSFLPDRDAGKSSLAYADVVVAGGMGLGAAENFQLVKTLAATLGPRIRLLATGGAEGLDAGRAADRPDRHDDPAEALHRGRHFRCHPAPRRRRGRGSDRGDQHGQERAPIFDFAHVGLVTDAIRFLPALTEAFARRLSPHNRDKLAG